MLLPGTLIVCRPSDPDGPAGDAVRTLRAAANAIDKVTAEAELTALELLAVDVAVTRLIQAHQRYRRALWWANTADETYVN